MEGWGRLGRVGGRGKGYGRGGKRQGSEIEGGQGREGYSRLERAEGEARGMEKGGKGREQKAVGVGSAGEGGGAGLQ